MENKERAIHSIGNSIFNGNFSKVVSRCLRHKNPVITILTLHFYQFSYLIPLNYNIIFT